MQLFKIDNINVFSLPYVFNRIFLSLTYFIARIQYIIHVTYQICVNQIFTLLIQLLVNSRLLLKF